MKVVVPMAGRGSRFQQAADTNPEYKKPKPLILVKGQPMITWALRSLPFVDLPQRPATMKRKATSKDLLFISLKAQEDEYGITGLLKELFGTAITVILIPEVTRGAAETALKAKEYIDTNEDVIISDSDHYFDGVNLAKMIEEKDSETVGIIPVFKPPDDEVKWSYTLFGDDTIATAVGEKDPLLAAKGAYANIGAYYFTRGDLFVSEAEAMIAENDMYGATGKQEFYIAPLYDRLIKKGRRVMAAVTPEVWGLGTPKDLEYFEKNYKP